MGRHQVNISFGIIVLNGMPFVRYCLRQLYPYAHEIIVVEGATQYAKQFATADGHSTDGTIEELERFVCEEDPDHKIILIKNSSFWNEKDEQSQAYARCATGNYLWQVDIDEFYMDEHIQCIISLLRQDPTISAMSVMTKTFFGSPKYEVESYVLRDGARIYHRIFQWKKGYTYTSHRPPTVIDEQGLNMMEKNYVDGIVLYKRHGIFMFHYSLLFPRQVEEKCHYYANWARKESVWWAKHQYDKLENPYRVHNIYESVSWLRRSGDQHPKQIFAMMRDISQGAIKERLRRTDDIEHLLQSTRYRLGSFFVAHWYFGCRFLTCFKRWSIRLLHFLSRKVA